VICNDAWGKEGHFQSLADQQDTAKDSNGPSVTSIKLEHRNTSSQYEKSTFEAAPLKQLNCVHVATFI